MSFILNLNITYYQFKLQKIFHISTLFKNKTKRENDPKNVYYFLNFFVKLYYHHKPLFDPNFYIYE